MNTNTTETIIVLAIILLLTVSNNYIRLLVSGYLQSDYKGCKYMTSTEYKQETPNNPILWCTHGVLLHVISITTITSFNQ